MLIDHPTRAQLRAIYEGLDARASASGTKCVKYLQVGTQVVRVLSYAGEFLPHMEAQWTYILRDEAPAYDATIVVWKEEEYAALAHWAILCDRASEIYRRSRMDKLCGRTTTLENELVIIDPHVHHQRPAVYISEAAKELRAWDAQTRTFYYAVNIFEPEEFIKRGHLCVFALARILSGPARNLGHGAVIGLGGKGVLVCGMGYRGKSTLSVTAMLEGFDYVSDDYLALEKENGILRAWPIYSIITLGPGIYQHLRWRLDATFISNNARKDKYVFNIARYYKQFVPAYPIDICVFPRFTTNAEPSLEPGDRAIATDEFAFSSVMQTGETQDMQLIAKLCGFVDELPCWRFNLTTDIFKNVRCLRAFLEQL